MTVEEIYELTAIDPWFLRQMQGLLETEKFLKRSKLEQLTADDLWRVKQQGFSDAQIAYATKTTDDQVRAYRQSLGVVPVYKTVDTCAAEFEAYTPYYYSTYERPVEQINPETGEVEPLPPQSEVLPPASRG